MVCGLWSMAHNCKGYSFVLLFLIKLILMNVVNFAKLNLKHGFQDYNYKSNSMSGQHDEGTLVTKIYVPIDQQISHDCQGYIKYLL